MVRFVREFSAARVTTGFLGTWGLQPTVLSKDLSALTRLRNFARRQKAAIRTEPQGWRQWAQAFFGDYVRSCPKQSTSLFNQLLEFRRSLSCRLSPGFANPIAAERWLALGFSLPEVRNLKSSRRSHKSIEGRAMRVEGELRRAKGRQIRSTDRG
jgi:hypothetical protein